MLIWKLRKYLRGSTIIHGRRTHQSVRCSQRQVYAWVRCWQGSARFDGNGLNFFHTSQTFCRWYMHIWKLRKYLRGSTIIHGRHTHQSVRNAKSTRGYVRADAKGQRGMMGIDWNFHTSQTFRRYCALIRKLCKYLCAPANITENTVAISQRFHVVKVWKNHTLENPLDSQIRKSVYLYGTERIGSRAGVGPI